jgi:hypothetical protein
MNGYDVAQICINGHAISSMAGSSPELRKPFCNKCGAVTTMKCLKCGKPIKGYYHVEGVFGFSSTYKVPKFCDNCGESFPWTETKLNTTKGLIDLIETLTSEEQNDFKITVEHLVRDTAETALSKIKFKKYIQKADSEMTNGIKEILRDLVSEETQKGIL